FPLPSGRLRPCRDGGGGEIALGFADAQKSNRASHIDPPASSYAIMRRACAPTAERTLDPARMFDEELDPRPGIREPRPKRDLGCRPQVATQQSLARLPSTRARLRHHARCGAGVARELPRE